MAEIKHIGARELRDLRAWRALVVEAYGVVRDLNGLEFALRLPMDDALAALGLSGSVWARERWCELRAALDEPLEEPVAEDGPELDEAA